MDKRHELLDASEQEALEVHGFDLMAQIEAMLRHIRQYQREVQRLRGILPKGQTDTASLPPVEALEKHVLALRKACEAFSETLDDVTQLVRPERGATVTQTSRPDDGQSAKGNLRRRRSRRQQPH